MPALINILLLISVVYTFDKMINFYEVFRTIKLLSTFLVTCINLCVCMKEYLHKETVQFQTTFSTKEKESKEL